MAREGETAVWRRVLVTGLVGATLASGLIGIEISNATDTTASWWPAAGVGVVALFVSPRTWWPRLVVALYLANLFGNVLGGQQWNASVCLAAADICETVLVCWVCRRLIGRHLEKLADLGWLVVVSLVGALVAGLGVALTSYTLLDGQFVRTLAGTTGSHWASVIVVAPLGLLPRSTVRRPQTVPIILHALLLTGVTLFAFGPGTDLTLGFAPLPFVIWAGVAFGSRVVVIEQVLMAGAITWLTVGGYGPFATPDHPAGGMTSNVITQLYLVCLVVTGLPLALSVRQHLSSHLAVLSEQQRTEAVIDSSTTPIIVTDGRGVVLSLNPAVTRLTGFSADDLVGRGFWERLFPADRWEATSAEFADPDLVPEGGETVIRTKAGGERMVTYANGRYHSPDDGSLQYVLTMNDVTEERATQHLLRHLLRSATTVAIVGTDRAGRITVLNAGAQALLRFDAHDASAGSFLDYLDPDEVSRRGLAAGVEAGFDVLVHGVTEAESRTRDWTWVPPDGVPIVVSMTTSMIADGSDRPIGYLFVARDVTETRRNQELLREALQREQLAVDHLRALDDAKDDFVSTVSHELRTPLTSIIGSIELLEDGMAGELQPAQLQMVDVIERNAERLLAMANDLLTLASYEGTTAPISHLEALDLRTVVRASHASVTGLLTGRDLVLDDDLPDAPVVVNGESAYLERAVTNLLSNAIKFTRDGGRISTRLWSNGDGTCHLDVADTGVGIPDDEVQDVFRRFFRSSNVRADAIQGTGLGLSIVHSIVERHQGQIDVQSREGQGTIFTITLPLADAVRTG
ncbi:MAG TPA: ATP-binding protein [Marmoricola sp.]|nr:ATP-binding protein [Marmoricola sp.]